MTKTTTDLPDFAKIFPSLTYFNTLIEDFNHKNTALENFHREIKNLLEQVKDDEVLSTYLIKSIANINALVTLSEKLAEKQTKINELKQSLQVEIEPHYLSYMTAMENIHRIKDYLFWCLYQGLSDYFLIQGENSTKHSDAIKSFNAQFEGLIEIDESGNLRGHEALKNLILNERLETSAAFINKLLAENTPWIWSSDKQVQMVDKIVSTAEMLTKLDNFTPFHAWQKNILLGKLHAGFSWDEKTKALEYIPIKELETVASKISASDYNQYREITFAEEEQLCDEISQSLTRLRLAIPPYAALHEIKKAVNNTLEASKNWSNEVSKRSDNILPIFESVAESYKADNVHELTLGTTKISLENNQQLQNFLQQKQLEISKQLAKLTTLASTIKKIEKLPEDEVERSKQLTKLTHDHEIIKNLFESASKNNQTVKALENEVLKARQRLSIGHKAPPLPNETIDVQPNLENASNDVQPAPTTIEDEPSGEAAPPPSTQELDISNENKQGIVEQMKETNHRKQPTEPETSKFIEPMLTERELDYLPDEPANEEQPFTQKKSFFKRHWGKMLIGAMTLALAAVTAIIITGTLGTLTTALMMSLPISAPFAAGLITTGVLLAGAGVGMGCGAIVGAAMGDREVDSKGFWQQSWKKIATAAATGIAIGIGAVAITAIGFAICGVPFLNFFSAFGIATAVSLSAFGANITSAAGVGIGLGMLSTTLAFFSGTVTGMGLEVKAAKTAGSPPPPAGMSDHPNVDPEREPGFNHAKINQRLFANDIQANPSKTAATEVTDEDLQDLLTSFETSPKLTQNKNNLGFLNTATQYEKEMPISKEQEFSIDSPRPAV